MNKTTASQLMAQEKIEQETNKRKSKIGAFQTQEHELEYAEVTIENIDMLRQSEEVPKLKQIIESSQNNKSESTKGTSLPDSFQYNMLKGKQPTSPQFAYEEEEAVLRGINNGDLTIRFLRKEDYSKGFTDLVDIEAGHKGCTNHKTSDRKRRPSLISTSDEDLKFSPHDKADFESQFDQLQNSAHIRFLAIEHKGQVVALALLQVTKIITDHDDPSMDRKVANLRHFSINHTQTSNKAIKNGLLSLIQGLEAIAELNKCSDCRIYCLGQYHEIAEGQGYWHINKKQGNYFNKTLIQFCGISSRVVEKTQAQQNDEN